MVINNIPLNGVTHWLMLVRGATTVKHVKLSKTWKYHTVKVGQRNCRTFGVGFANEAEQLGTHPQLKTSFEVASCSVDIELDAEMLAGLVFGTSRGDVRLESQDLSQS